ncbi:hypothetical protein BJX96DRAFT_143566 [Aspergillus floccosus]
MRSGLQKPGAIPFLALLVFLLLSLVPSLAKEWDLYSLQLRYIGYPRHEVRHLPRVKDASSDIRSRLWSPGVGAPCKSWTLIDGSCPLNPLSRPRSAVLDTPPRSSLAAPTVDPEANSYPTESSPFSRGVRAFKTFLTKRLDDFSTRNASEVVPARPMSTLRNVSAASVAAGKEATLPKPVGLEAPQTTIKNASFPRVFSLYRDSWQLVCQAGSDYFGNITRVVPLKISRPLSFLQRNAEPQSPLDDSGAPSGQQLVPKRTVLDDDHAVKPACSPTFRPVAHAIPTQASNQTTSAAEHSTGLDQRPEHMRGSCMAIVISLVVGVMWF